MNKWEGLINSLGIEEADITEDNIQALRSWCKKYISLEVEFSGALNEQLIDLKKYISFFLETTSGEQDLCCAQQRLKGMNLIQWAASQGYDCYLEQVLVNAKNPQVLVTTTTNSTELTPLHLAAYRGHKITSEILFKKSMY